MEQPGRGTSSDGLSTVLYAATIFLGAFLLFQVQPLIGKYVLPWFGGSAGVWAAALLFFQLFLLLGYLYAHVVATWLSPRVQAFVHIGVLAVTLATLPIIPSEALRPEGASNPVGGILLLLALTIGAPYLALSANGPLLQSWFARQHPGRSPYRLYALSNVASLLALFSYPLWFERAFALGGQAWLWSGTYVAFAALCAVVAFRQLRALPSRGGVSAMPAAGDATPAPPPDAPAPWWHIALWVALPAVASAMLLATTTNLTQDIAPVPLLWVLPLGVYLVTFILTFDSDRWYFRPLYAVLLLVCLGLTTYNVAGAHLGLVEEVTLRLATLYFLGMVCHGELVALRPGYRHLTLFYLAVSAGGAIGGALVALAAPLLFNGYWEFQIGLVVGAAVAAFAISREYLAAREGVVRYTYAFATAVAIGLTVGIGQVLWGAEQNNNLGVLLETRGFYGALKVNEVGGEDPSFTRLQLVHGQTLHGIQYRAPEQQRWHTSYYGEASGIGLSLDHHPKRAAGQPLRVGLIGLGTGTLATYLQRGDYGRFYEINPQVLDVANEYFTYLGDARAAGADLEVLLGDARVVMERQLEAQQGQQFDVLAVDAFSSDSIPIHLLTREALEMYRRHMASGGIIAIHISNRFLDLGAVVRAIAADQGFEARFVANDDDSARGVNRSEWVLLTDNGAFLQEDDVRSAIDEWPANGRPPVLWTDDYSALLPVLRWF